MGTYLSAEGLEKLKQELEERKTVRRREITERISSAKELGDLSENFEYHDAKEQQGFNEARVAQLEQMVKEAVMVEQQSGGHTIELGTTFTVQSDGTQKTYEMVGSNEADPLRGKISNESPLGHAFLGRRVGEKVMAKLPGGLKEFEILSIR